MSEQTIIQNSDYVKPCVKCGAMDRCKRGKCKPCAKERVRNWQSSNPEKVRASSRKWKEANSDINAEYNSKWAQANRNQRLDYQRNWREINKEKSLETSRTWKKENPQRIKTLHHNRRAKIKGNGGKLSPDIIKTLMALQNGKCACCGKRLKGGHHLDHIMPLKLGGTNTDDNVQLLTPSCNLRKSAKHPDDWARENGRLL